jgi:hypothetical protein
MPDSAALFVSLAGGIFLSRHTLPDPTAHSVSLHIVLTLPSSVLLGVGCPHSCARTDACDLLPRKPLRRVI